MSERANIRDVAAKAGVAVKELRARGHTHLSPTMVDVVVSGEPVRAAMAEAIRGFFGTAAQH